MGGDPGSIGAASAGRQAPPDPPDTTKLIPFSDFIRSGVLPMTEIVGPIFDEINEKYGTNVKPIFE